MGLLPERNIIREVRARLVWHVISVLWTLSRFCWRQVTEIKSVLSLLYLVLLLLYVDLFGFWTGNTELGAVQQQRPVLSVAQGFHYFIQFRCGFFDNNCRIDFALALWQRTHGMWRMKMWIPKKCMLSGFPLYISIPVRTVIQKCEIRRRVLLAVRAIACPELRIDLRNLTGYYLHTHEVMFLVSLSSQITKQMHAVSEVLGI